MIHIYGQSDTSQVIELIESGDYSVDASLKSEWKWITGENTTVLFNDFQQYENEIVLKCMIQTDFSISN